MSNWSWIGRQFEHPRGPLGRLAGLIMNRTNRRQNEIGIDLLEIQPQDRVLVIGPGNGLFLGEIAVRANQGRICGLDVSETMVAGATRRNRPLIKKGRLDLRVGTVEAIPYGESVFDKVYSANTIYFWTDRSKALSEIRRVLKPGGALVVAFRSRQSLQPLKWMSGRAALYEPEEVRELLQAAGFHRVRLKSEPDGRLDACCAVGIR